MYPPSSTAPQTAAPVPTYPVSSAYGPTSSSQGTPVAVQRGIMPTSSPGPVAARSQQYPAPLSSKPAPVVPPGGIRSATVTSNYTGSLTDGFNSMHLQVCYWLLVHKAKTLM